MFLHHTPLPLFPTFPVLQFVSQFHELMKVTLYSCHFPEEKLLFMCQHRFKRPSPRAKKNKTKTHGSSILSALGHLSYQFASPSPVPTSLYFLGLIVCLVLLTVFLNSQVPREERKQSLGPSTAFPHQSRLLG